MTTFTYSSAGLSVKDRLTISNLLSLFASRLTAKWISVNPPLTKPANVVLVDVDQPDGLNGWEGPNPPAGRIALTANEQWPAEPFVVRPIRAYGHNGLIVLFNAIAEKLTSSPSSSSISPSHGFATSASSPRSAASPSSSALLASTSSLASVGLNSAAASPSVARTPAAPPTPVRENPMVPSAPEPAGIRMAGRFEVAAAPLREMRPQWPLTLKPPVSRAAATPPLNPPAAEPTPVRARVAVRWAPPEPIVLPILTRMPNARIHRFEETASEPVAVEIALAAPVVSVSPSEAPAPELRPSISWSTPPPAAPLPSLAEMPVAHRPVEIHTPSAPVIGRSRLEAHTHTPNPTPQIAEEIPVLRPVPPQWRTVEPDFAAELFDFRIEQDSPVISATGIEPLAEPATDEISVASELPVIGLAAPDLPAIDFEVSPNIEDSHEAEFPAEVSPIIPADVVPASAEATSLDLQPAPSYDVWDGALLSWRSESQSEIEVTRIDGDPEIQVPFADVHNLSEAIAAETPSDELPEFDASAGWWGSPEEEDSSDPLRDTEASSTLLGALKAIKASAQPSILEIAGLPAVCVIPERNVYFTTAPAVRLENTMNADSQISWRTCASETEARQLSGTEQSRQSSLEQLFWAACLMSTPADPQSMVDHAVRLRRWPPITESRGRSKYLRYATLLSGAQATPREIAEITGDTVEEVVGFVDACSKMNLLETNGQPKTRPAFAPMHSDGAGILRDMIGQLTPPKI